MAASRATVEIVATLRDQVTGTMRGIVGGIRSAVTGLRGLLGGLTAGAFFAGVKGVAEMEAALLRMARSTRSTVEDVSALRFALDDLSIGSGQLKSVLDQIEGKRSDALRGGGAARTAFGRLGVDLEELRKLGAVDLLRQIGDGYLGAGQSADAAAQLQALFGDRFRELLPLLAQGTKGFEALNKKAGALGAIVSTQDAEAAAKFTAVYTEFATVATGLFRDLANKILPFLTEQLRNLRLLLGRTTPEEALVARIKNERFIEGYTRKIDEKTPSTFTFSESEMDIIKRAGGKFDRLGEGRVMVFNVQDIVDNLEKDLQKELNANPLEVKSKDGDKGVVFDNRTFFEGFREEISETGIELGRMFEQGKKFAREFQDAFVGSVTSTLRDLRNGAIETRDVLSAMLDGFIEDLTDIATRRLTEQIFNSLASWGTSLFTSTPASSGSGVTAGAQLAGGSLGRRRFTGNFNGPSGMGGGGTVVNMTSNASAEEQRALVSAIMRHEASRNRQVRTTFRLV